MNEHYVVSIIVPVYNMEKTVEKCLNSVIKQSYAKIEIIVINDGSTDDSKRIINKISKKEPRIVFIDQENKGLSLAYQKGIEVAKGKFLIFVDSDDYIDSDMVEDLVQAQKRSGADIVQSGVRRICVDSNKVHCSNLEDRIYKNKDDLYLSYFLTNKINKTLAGNLIKRSMFEGLYFPKESLSLDLQIMPFLLKRSNYVQQISRAHYSAMLYSDSVSRSKVSDRIFEDRFYCTAVWENFFNEKAKNMKDILFYRRVYVSMDLYCQIKERPECVSEAKIKMLKCITEFSSNYLLMKRSFIYEYLSKNEKIKMKMFRISPILYISFMRIYHIKVRQSAIGGKKSG